MKPDVVCVAPISDPITISQRANAEFNLINKEELNSLDDLNSIQALITTSHDGVPNKIWECPNLKIISCFGVGYDGLDVERATSNNIWLSNTPNVLNDEVADLAIGMMIALLREIPQAFDYAKNKSWEKVGNYPLSAGLMDKTLGLLGMGGIGQEIAKRAVSCKLKIKYTSRNPKEYLPYEYIPDLVNLAEESDILCCIVPGGKETSKLVNHEVLAALGSRSYLINISRGSVVDEAALIKAIQNKVIAGAALDVYENEPIIPDELINLDNVLLLPHIGSGTVNTRNKMGNLMIDNIIKVLNGEQPLTPVNKISS